DDFSRFGDRQPYVYDHAGSSSLEVTYSAKMDVEHPGWHLGRDYGTPLYIVQDGDTIILWPTPTRAWTLNFNYVPIPDELVEMDQVPFNGRPDLNRYAPALAYKVAFLLLLPRAPTLAKYFEDLYIREEKKLRHYVRTNPQKTQSIFPVRHPKPGRRGPGAPPRKKPGPGPGP